MSDSSQRPAIVVDNGSSSIRAGFSGADSPRSVFPSIIGTPRHANMIGLDDRHHYIGGDAQAKRGILNIKYPIQHGIVTNWDSMEKIWHHIFQNELSVDPEEQPILMTEAPLNPKGNREKMTQIMFETFNVPAMYVSISSVLALQSTGRNTGLIVDSGSEVTHVVPVHEGHARAIQRIDIGGRDTTDHLTKLLAERGNCFTTNCEREIAVDMKEKLCYVAVDFDAEMAKDGPELAKSYELPDGNVWTVGNERFRGPELLFNPLLIGRKMGGVHDVCKRAVGRCDVEMRFSLRFSLRKELLQNIVLAGGNTLFDGFAERLEREIAKLSPEFTPKVTGPALRTYSAWLGGSMIAEFSETSAYHPMVMIVKEEYEEYGPMLAHRRPCY